jgi:beta propeller domain-containing protein
MLRTIPIMTLLTILVSACSSSPPRAGASLEPFTAERPLDEFVRKSGIWAEESYQSWGWGGGCPDDSDDCVLEEIVVTAMKRDSSESITNNQEEGVDEGDIVKRVGDYIVLLRRGRLFTFALPTNRNQLSVVDYTDVAPPEEDIDAWYDEILSHGNKIILLGYSYDIEASLIRMFQINRDGELSSGQSYFFKSSDYFDPENYATRLVDGHLVFYMPRDLPEDGAGMISGQIVNGEPVNVGSAFSSETIYQPIQQSSDPVLHTVARCPLDEKEFRCSATSFIGPWAQLFYISNDAVYLWLNSSGWAYDYFLMSDRYVRRIAKVWQDVYDESGDLAVVYRVPIKGGVPGVVEARGWPINQFSFRETRNTLQVFARDSVWGPETQPTILDIPLSQFGVQISKLSESQYEYLPPLAGDLNVNRFVGSSLLYDDMVYEGDSYQASVWVKNLDSRLPPVRLSVDHLVERIEPVGDVAVAIGTDDQSALGLTSIGTGSNPLLGQTTWLHRAVQADERSHSFNFRRDRSFSVIGFPVIYAPEDERYDYFWPDEANDVHMTYFGLTPDLGFQMLGEIVGHSTEDDDCQVSCSDWYGDSRPFFIDDQIYALLGYELIEGYLSGATLQESARVNGLELLPGSD